MEKKIKLKWKLKRTGLIKEEEMFFSFLHIFLLFILRLDKVLMSFLPKVLITQFVTLVRNNLKPILPLLKNVISCDSTCQVQGFKNDQQIFKAKNIFHFLQFYYLLEQYQHCAKKKVEIPITQHGMLRLLGSSEKSILEDCKLITFVLQVPISFWKRSEIAVVKNVFFR